MEELSDGGSQNPLQSLDFVSERIEHIDLEDHAVEDGANHGFAPEAVAEGLSYDDLKLPETTVVKIMKEVVRYFEACRHIVRCECYRSCRSTPSSLKRSRMWSAGYQRFSFFSSRIGEM